MRVFVCWNLHRKCWSIKALTGPSRGRVIGHAEYVDLACVEWKVSEAGRQRVLKKKKKNVHAGAVGILESWTGTDWRAHKLCGDKTLFDLNMEEGGASVGVTYNPYKGGTFTDVATGAPVRASRCAYLCPDRRVSAYGVI